MFNNYTLYECNSRCVNTKHEHIAKTTSFSITKIFQNNPMLNGNHAVNGVLDRYKPINPDGMVSVLIFTSPPIQEWERSTY
jgi:hypothetical protein